MKPRRLLMSTVALTALAGCSDTTTVSAERTLPATTASSNAETAFLEALRAIDGRLTQDREAAIRAGENVCLDIQQGKDADTVANNAAARLQADPAQAGKIIVAATTTLCGASG